MLWTRGLFVSYRSRGTGHLCASTELRDDGTRQTDVALIWAYLGGVEKGWITVTDLDHFFHGTVPPNKTRFWLDIKLLGDAMAAHKSMW
jgi:hypothetical protein